MNEQQQALAKQIVEKTNPSASKVSVSGETEVSMAAVAVFWPDGLYHACRMKHQGKAWSDEMTKRFAEIAGEKLLYWHDNKVSTITVNVVAPVQTWWKAVKRLSWRHRIPAILLYGPRVLWFYLKPRAGAQVER